MPPKFKAKAKPAPVAAPDKYRLTERILKLSNANDWESAKDEWAVESIFRSDEPGTCLCGHQPIYEQCVIVNLQNGHETIVGNVCVNKFLGLPSDKLFTGINRITAKPTRSLNVETIDYAFEKRWINDYEKNFYLNTKANAGRQNSSIGTGPRRAFPGGAGAVPRDGQTVCDTRRGRTEGTPVQRPIAGTKLIRENPGIEHCVTVRADDFEYIGRPHKSLSSIAPHQVEWPGVLWPQT